MDHVRFEFLRQLLDDLRTRPAGQWVLERYAEDR